MEGFADADRLVAQGQAGPDQPAPQRGGLPRRIPGTHVSAAALRATPATARTGGQATRPAAPPVRDPEAERDQMAGFLDGFTRGAQDAPTTTDPPALEGAR
jgi:hypothetical protein